MPQIAQIDGSALSEVFKYTQLCGFFCPYYSIAVDDIKVTGACMWDRRMEICSFHPQDVLQRVNTVIAGTDPDTCDKICTHCKLHIQESCLSGLPTPFMEPCLSVDAHLFVTQT